VYSCFHLILFQWPHFNMVTGRLPIWWSRALLFLWSG